MEEVRRRFRCDGSCHAATTCAAPAFEPLEARVLLSADGLSAVGVAAVVAGVYESGPLADPAIVYVDDDGVHDPGPDNPAVSDPLENGSQEHPFDRVQEGIDAVAVGGQVHVADGTYGEAVTIAKNLTLYGGYNGADWSQSRDPNLHPTTLDAAGRNQSVVSILNADATMDGLTIRNGNAPLGGGVYCENGNQTIRACRIVDNGTWDGGPLQSGGDGGGIYALGVSLLLADCVIEGNQTGAGGAGMNETQAGPGGDGGGLCVLSSTVEITGCRFSNATGPGGVGGPEHASGGDGGHGGALYAESSVLTIKTSEFDWNHTGKGGDKPLEFGDAGDGGNGAAVCLQAGSVAEIIDCTFDDNRTGAGGDGSATLDAFGGSGGHGGAVYCASSTLTAQGSAFDNNTTGDGGKWGSYYVSGTGDGGALRCDSSTVLLTDCEFTSNVTGRAGDYRYAHPSGRGGAACFLDSEVTVDGCLVQWNKTGDGRAVARGNGRSGQGGGLLFDDCPTAHVYNCVIAENATGDLKGIDGENPNRTGDGGGLAILNSSSRVENCLIYGNVTGDGEEMEDYGNSSGNGGGIYCRNNTEATIVGCTIAANRCGLGGTSYYIKSNGEGGGVYGDATTALANTILWANLQGDIIGLDAANVSYCDVTDWMFDGVNHSVSVNPRFADMVNGNYRLRPDSPVINLGDNAAVSPEGMTDLDGNPRIADGAVDIGAYEAAGESRTLGHTTVFSNVSTVSNRRAMPFVTTEAGVLTSISIYHQGGTGHAVLAVYADASGHPGARLGVTDSTTINSSEGWQTIALQSPVAVAAGQTVWLAWVFENDPGMRWMPGTPGRASSTATWSGGMPASFGGSTLYNGIYSIYANYSTGADVTPPGNVAGFIATPGDGQITLNWTNPGDADFAGVRILRKQGGYPTSLIDGVVVYNGPAASCVDSGLTNGTSYYYKAFSYDEVLNCAAGVTATAIPSAADTAGYTTVFSNISTVANRRAVPVVVTEAGYLTSISIYHQGGMGHVILAVYNDASGHPGTQLSMTNSTTINAVEGWQTILLGSQVPVSVGQTIWLAWVFENDPGMRWAPGTPGRAISTATWSGGMPYNFGSSLTEANAVYSIYAAYADS